MTKPVISVEHLTKKYDLGVIGTGTLTRDVERWWARVRHQPDPYTIIGQKDTFASIGESILALDDVSFSVEQGETLGIIGRNGAGKSTLLKILSRVTAPTSGVVKVKGRIGSLLEVGTGFHPELTGRENVFLNGAILGMKKAEVARKFDEIVEFSGVGKYIDTPVKRYSSGMYVRLGFSVAAHLDPEILIVDEVLAVGDAEFQKKCLGKMGEVAGEGRTVLFVSHHMTSILRLCSRAIWITAGKLFIDGNSNDVVSAYISENVITNGQKEWEIIENAPGNEKIRLRSIKIQNLNGSISSNFSPKQPIIVEICYEILQKTPPMRIAFALSDGSGVDILSSADQLDANWENISRERGVYKSICTIPGNLLRIGNYSIRVSAEIPFKEIMFLIKDTVGFGINETEGVGSKLPENWPGVIRPLLNWHVEKVS